MFIVFMNTATDHTCNKPGCESVLVLDGNIKNARQVCSCHDVGELKFAGMDGSVVIGKYSNLIILFGHTVFTEGS